MCPVVILAHLKRTWQRKRALVSVAILILMAVLLWLSPAEASLGNVVKIVYLHASAERISVYAFLAAAALGLAQLALRKGMPPQWTRAVLETAIVFWIAQFAISLPAQVLAWGGLAWNEPRVIEATWILSLTVLVYVVALWMDDPNWMAVAACAAAVIVVIVLRGGVNILHPFNAIAGSDSASIKFSYGAIVIGMGALAFQFAWFRTATAGRLPGEK